MMNHGIVMDEHAMQEKSRLAREIFGAISEKTVPRKSTLQGLYGEEKAQILLRNIEDFITSNNGLFGKPRMHHAETSAKVSATRDRIETEKAFQEVQSRLLFNKLPPLMHMETMYGEYAEPVMELFRAFFELRMVRQCGLPSVTHMNRVGAIVRWLPMDDPGRHEFAAAAAMHDGIEDLLLKAVDANRDHYGIDRYVEFVDTFIPAALQTSVKALTNHYDLLITHVVQMLQKEDKFISPKNFKIAVEKTLEGDNVDMHPYIETIWDVVENETLGPDVVSDVKWLLYKDVYIKRLAVDAHTGGDYRLYEVKGIDLSDNGHGRGSLSVNSRIKNMIKHQVWINNMRVQNPTWPPIIEMMDELQADVLRDAETMVLQDLLEPQSSQDFLLSALLKFKKLGTVLYG